MTPLGGDAAAQGGVLGGTGRSLVEHTADTHLARSVSGTLNVNERGRARFRILTIREWSEVACRIDRASRTRIARTWRRSSRRWACRRGRCRSARVATHDLDIPRVGYVHSWTRTQDEGWWRAAFDAYGIPYMYFADQKLRDGNLRAKYDVIVFPNIGGMAASQVGGVPLSGSTPLPYKRTAETPNLSPLDTSDDIRGGMGQEGLEALAKFVRQGGTLLTEGSTAALFSSHGVAADTAAEQMSHPTSSTARCCEVFSPTGGARSRTDTIRRTCPCTSTRRRCCRSTPKSQRSRVVMRFPQKPDDILLSGSLANGRRLSNRPLLVDERIGSGHLVIYALRPFWRWQTQGAYPLVFNAILNWNDLD